MMPIIDNRTSQILENLAESLDIPPHKYQQAVDRYSSVGDWLKRPGSSLAIDRPDIYPQGSFRLGTVVRPLRTDGQGDYDIDLVCELSRQKSHATPEEVKHDVGDRLKEHGTYRSMLEPEGRRCWTLVYAEQDDIGFHMDVLPCIPDDYIRKELNELAGGYAALHSGSSVAITHRDEPGSPYRWDPSNPRGYGNWFDQVNQSAHSRVALSQKKMIFERNADIYMRMEDVPDALVRTPLQRAIQIFKRHRDVRFEDHELKDEKPISIIITTLAASAYDGEDDVYQAIVGIIERIEQYDINGLIKKVKGEWYIPNPVQPDENFADRWNEPGSRRAEAFFMWLEWLKADLEALTRTRTKSGLRQTISESFGTDIANKTVGLSESLVEDDTTAIVPRFDNVPVLGDTGHVDPPPWSIVGKHRASIKGTIHRSRLSPSMGTIGSQSLPKGVELRFEVETAVDAPYEVRWQVVNTGSEAASRGTLRGDFYQSDEQSRKVRWESTAYAGTHWVEAFIIKNGRCLARTGPCYVPIENS